MPIHHLQIETKTRTYAARMSRAGFDDAFVAQHLHLEFDDVTERRSAMCPYEQRRAFTILTAAAKLPIGDKMGAWYGTLGDPKLRLRPRDIDQFSPTKVLRRWRSGIQKLRRINPKLIGICVVELQLCRSLDRPANGGPRYFFEPHFHFVIYGVTEAQVRAAFKVRANPSVTLRKRPLKVKAVYDLEGLFGYFTKSKPEFRRQHLNADGEMGWGRSRFPDRHSRKWYATMSQYKVADLLSATGVSLRFLARPGVAELATTSSRVPPERHRGPVVQREKAHRR